MARILSKPTTLVIDRVLATWGSGGDAGSFAADVWTPGRDADGQVNAASWALVPSGRWVQVEGTRVDSLDARVKAAVPSWAGKSLDWEGILQSWSGFATDPAYSRCWLLGGGHSNGYNNGLYRFDVLKMAWAVECMPSDRSGWSAGYLGNYSASNNPESTADAQVKRAAGTLKTVNDAFYDELPGDQKPTARHTYSSMVHVAETNELVMVCRRLWRYSMTTGQWNYRRLINDQFDPWMDGENIVGIYDEVKREVLTSSSGSMGFRRSIGYDLASNRWTGWGAPWTQSAGVADARHGRNVTVVMQPEQAGGSYASPGYYWRYNLDTCANEAAGELQFASGVSRADFPPVNWYYDGSSLTYVASQNRYWLCTQMANGQMGFFEIDPTTTPWTLSRKTFSGTVPRPAALLKRRMIYWPALNAVTLTDQGNNNLAIYKL